jgi:REP element-mobilizing transposase RayT
MKPHFMALDAAYQLHYYLWFKTHCLRPLLATAERQTLVQSVLMDVCGRNDYHLLESDSDQKHLRLLLSLQPTQSVSQAVRLVKGNLQHQFGKSFHSEKLLAKGYFARSSGKVDLERARHYETVKQITTVTGDSGPSH